MVMQTSRCQRGRKVVNKHLVRDTSTSLSIWHPLEMLYNRYCTHEIRRITGVLLMEFAALPIFVIYNPEGNLFQQLLSTGIPAYDTRAGSDDC